MLGLAKRGFRMSGCDLSPAAVERARREAANRGFDIPVAAADMRDLSGVGGSDFDGVICLDNALPHLESDEAIVKAAGQHARETAARRDSFGEYPRL